MLSKIKRIFKPAMDHSAALSIDGSRFSFILLSTEGTRPKVAAAAQGQPGQGTQDMAGAIRACLPGALRRKRILVSAPLTEIVRGRNIFTKLVEIPRMPRRDAIRALIHMEKDSAMFPLSEAAADVTFYGAASGKTKNQAMFTAVEKKTGASVLARRNALGIRRGGACSAAAVIFSMIERSEILGADDASLVVCVGRSSTGIYAHWRGAPLFTREIRFGAENLAETAEDIKTLSSDGLNSQDTRKRLEGPLTQLETEISRSIDFFKTASGGAVVEKTRLMFDGVRINGLDAHLSAELGAPFCEYTPFGDIVDVPQGEVARVIDGSESAFAPLVGAALCQAYVNVPRRKWRTFFRVAPAQWRKAAAVAAVIVTGGALIASEIERRFDLMDGAIASKRKLADRLDIVEEETNRAAMAIARLKKQNKAYETLLSSLETSPRVQNWETVFREIAMCVPGDSALSRWTMDFAAGERSRNIIIAGVSRGPSHRRIADVGALYKSLRSSLSLNSVTLNKTVLSKGVAGEELLNFEIRAALPQAPHSAASMAGGEIPGS